jgi:TolB-like protein
MRAARRAQQYFSDGISEDLITALSQFPGLKVIGRTSAFQFRDSKEDSRSIGAKLGVAHLLEGSVRHAGEMVRVSAELIDTADGSTQWSERYDRPYKDLFALQDEITHAVAVALKAHLVPRSVPPASRGLLRSHRVCDLAVHGGWLDRYPWRKF